MVPRCPQTRELPTEMPLADGAHELPLDLAATEQSQLIERLDQGPLLIAQRAAPDLRRRGDDGLPADRARLLAQQLDFGVAVRRRSVSRGAERCHLGLAPASALEVSADELLEGIEWTPGRFYEGSFTNAPPLEADPEAGSDQGSR